MLVKNTDQAEGLTEHFHKLSDTSKSLTSVIETNQNQIKSLETHMGSLNKFGDDLKIITSTLSDFSKTIQTSVSNQSEGLNKLSKKLDGDLTSSLGNLEKALVSLTDKFRDDYEHFLNTIKNLQGKV